jgi:hypothetical protein
MSRRFRSADTSLARRTLAAVVNYPISIFFWVKNADWAAVGNDFVALGETYGTSTDSSVFVRTQAVADRITASARDTAGEGNSILDFTADSGNGVWVPVLATYTSATSRLIRAFSPTQTGAASTAERIITDLMDEISVGRNSAGANAVTDAYMAELAIWNAALGTTEFETLVTGATAGISPDQVLPGDLIGYWSMNSDTGGTIPDESGNSNDLTISGTVSYAADHPTITYATSRFLKILVHPDAASASAVEGIVWAAGGIAGAEIGEFTGAEFEAETEGSGDAERAVLLVPVADFGGGSLSVDDVVPCLVRNATFTSGLTTGTVIEE